MYHLEISLADFPRVVFLLTTVQIPPLDGVGQARGGEGGLDGE